MNASFENGRKPWFALNLPDKPYWEDFQISDTVAHSGSHSAFLSLRSSAPSLKTRIVGVIQEFESLDKLPKRLSGWYRIQDWVQGTRKQYFQVVVIVWGAKNITNPVINESTPAQIAYVLGGIDFPPFLIDNRRFVFVEKSPSQDNNEWIYFERDLHADYIKYWGAVPEQFAKVRILFEVRYDGLLPNENTVSADVFYDDLYFGD